MGQSEFIPQSEHTPPMSGIPVQKPEMHSSSIPQKLPLGCSSTGAPVVVDPALIKPWLSMPTPLVLSGSTEDVDSLVVPLPETWLVAPGSGGVPEVESAELEPEPEPEPSAEGPSSEPQAVASARSSRVAAERWGIKGVQRIAILLAAGGG